MKTLNTVENLKDLNKLICTNSTQMSVGTFGGRYIQIQGESCSLNDIVKKFHQLCDQNQLVSEKEAGKIIAKIEHLDQDGNKALKKATGWKKVATYARQFFGNLFYKRNKILARLSPSLVPVTDKENPHMLHLKTSEGVIQCRTFGQPGEVKPRLTENKTVECKLRSHLRLRNLKTIRGNDSGKRMIGPLDYYGNLESPHQYLYTIQIDEKGIPQFFRKPKIYSLDTKPVWKDNIDDYVTQVGCSWISGKDLKADEGIQLGYSLFPNEGILRVKGCEKIELKQVDATQVDLSSFKARLIKNDTPFKLTDEKLPASDEFRAVTYHYEPKYAQAQVASGGGLFLETHTFLQTLTPLFEHNAGFVTLGRWSDETEQQLELIGVQVPFGYTIIIDSGCIHGDANFEGKFLMTMTTNHTTMQKADSVFLKKDSDLSKNVPVTIKGVTPGANSLNNYSGSIPKQVHFN